MPGDLRRPAKRSVLHIAKSIGDLNDKIALSEETLSKKKPEMLLRTAEKALQGAEENLKMGDEEVAYLNHMKYLQIVGFLQKCHGYRMTNKEKLLYKNSLDCAENLCKGLTERYEELDTTKLELQQKQRQHSPVIAAEVIQPAAVVDTPTDPSEPHFDTKLSCFDLYQLIAQFRGTRKLLIMDVRSNEDFKESHLDAPCVVNVPDNIIVPGSSASKLQEKIPEESRAQWETRGESEYVVILDWSSFLCQLLPASKIIVLRNILLKWDPKNIYKHEPLVLEGGYEEWLGAYPTHTTNPHAKPPEQSALDELLFDSIEYPELVDNPSPRTLSQMFNKPLVNRAAKPPMVTEMPAQPRPVETVVVKPEPVSAPQPSTPQVDRASKQMAIERMERERARSTEKILQLTRQQEEKHREMDELRRSREAEADSEIKSLKIQGLLEEIEVLERRFTDEESEKRRIQKQLDEALASLPQPGTTASADTAAPRSAPAALRTLKPATTGQTTTNSQPEDSPNRKPTTGQPDVPVDQLKFEALKMDGPSSGALTRSHSSPNINKIVEGAPQFDRNTKPMAQRPSTEHLRHRDFDPVYGNKGRGLTGLKNLGNSCYMNSIVQCISNTVDLTDYFCTGTYRKDVNPRSRGHIVEELAAVVRALWTGEYRAIACRDFKRVAGFYHSDFAGFRQQDSHEFLTLLMDWLHDDLNKYRHVKPPPSPANSERELEQRPLDEQARLAWHDFRQCNESRIQALFYGQQSSTVQCNTCRFESVTFEPFSSLTLVLPPDKDKCSLSHCLGIYLAPEPVSEWKCPRCKCIRAANKKFDIWRLPAILVIHFKRFYEDVLWRKQHTLVDFPRTRLDMLNFTPNVSQKHGTYNLYAVSNHYGTMDGGHYTTYSHSSLHNKWYKFDDSDVTEISDSTVHSNAAYILFYASIALPAQPRFFYSPS